MLTRSEAREKLYAKNAFLANVIECHHRKPHRKYNGALNLMNAGHSVEIGTEIDFLLIDGHKASWCVLEEWATRKY